MSTSTANPLLARRFDIPFEAIRAEQVEPAVETLLVDARARLEALIAAPGPRTYDNTMRALDELTLDLEWAMGIVHHLEAVATTSELRAARNAVLPAISTFQTQLLLSEGLYAALKSFAATPEAQALNPVRARFLRTTLEDFRREGAELDAAGKLRLEALNCELDEVTTRFGEHVIDSTAAFECIVTDEARLSGLPESARAAARADAEQKHRVPEGGLGDGVDDGPGWRFTLQAPSYVAVVTYAEDAELRRELYLAYNARATAEGVDNRPLLRRILQLRREKARLLGYADFADYVLADRMARTGARAGAFVDDLTARTRAFFERETAELQAFRKELEGADAAPLQPWDVAYYAEKLRHARFDFDDEALRPYFPMFRVMDGLFEIANRLYGITVVEVPRDAADFPGAWSDEVRFFRIQDAEGVHLGSFYADFFPRDTKRGGAWMGDFWTGGPQPGGGHEPHLGVICGNLTPPLGDAPALLTHDEVETIFHEFGHLLHHCLSKVEVKSLSGTNVAWDFVELPSQIMENWCWEKEALDLFARHHQTGELLPDALRDKMMAARNFRSASAQMRQLGFAAMDLSLHTAFDDTGEADVIAYTRDIMGRYSAVPLREDYAMIAGFTHLFDNAVGYAAGYYSYKWAEVLDADAFTRFKEHGVFAREVGRAFWDTVLAKGDSEEPLVLFERFMGRSPDPAALMRRAGLQSQAGAP